MLQGWVEAGAVPTSITSVANDDDVCFRGGGAKARLVGDGLEAAALCSFEVARGVLSEPGVAAAETGGGAALGVGDGLG